MVALFLDTEMSQGKDTLNEWLDYILSSHPENVIELGLGRMKKMLDRLDIHFDCPVITVAGTNGKGSTCAMLEAIYRAAGYKTAMHTSPHMLSFNERAQINGEIVEDAPLVEAFREVEAARARMPLTYFEFTALGILRVFQKAKPDVVILEIGLGGRLDAINALQSTASIVTTIGIDHEAYLGNTRDAIGWEKAHIYRQGHPAVCADKNPPVKLLQYAKALKTNLVVAGKDFSVTEEDGGRMRFKMGVNDWDLPRPALCGRNQMDNAAGVLALIVSLMNKLPVTIADIEKGLTTVRITARFEKVQSDPTVILDVGHNPHAANVLAQNIRDVKTQGKVIAVFGMLADKDMIDVVKIMSEVIDEWFITGLPGPRGASADVLHKVMLEAGVEDGKITQCDGVEEAYNLAKRQASIIDTIIIFGSFVTVTAALPLVQTNARVQ